MSLMVVVQGSHVAVSGIKGYGIGARPEGLLFACVQLHFGGKGQQCALHGVALYGPNACVLMQCGIVTQNSGACYLL